jgi:hypothetical protein
MMSEQLPRSAYDMVGGLVYFPRMFDKIRLHARGDLPEAYHNNLGRELDGWIGVAGRASISSILMKAARHPISVNRNCPGKARNFRNQQRRMVIPVALLFRS